MTAFLVAGIATLHAEEVATEHQGLDVLGNLEIAQGKTLKTDGAVLLVHGSLGHNRMEIVSAAQELLRERGINSLAITLSLGLDHRQGMFDCSLEQDHRHDDAIDEIETWVNWLKEKGAATITLAGHDRGASQAAAYAGLPKVDRTVRRLILFGPLLQTFDGIDRDYFQRYKKVLRDELSRAEQLVSQDEASTLMDTVGFLECSNTKVTAGAFVDYYSNNQKFFTPSLLPSVRMPTLVIGGGADPQEPQLSRAMRELGGQKNIIFEEVQSADHFFRDSSADELADRIKDFMGRKVESAAALPPPVQQSQPIRMKTKK
jgi:pimeloyl-ACP methyl ester carboxylesterase